MPANGNAWYFNSTKVQFGDPMTNPQLLESIADFNSTKVQFGEPRGSES